MPGREKKDVSPLRGSPVIKALAIALLLAALLPGETLREAAAARGVTIGAAVTFPGGANRAPYEEVLRTEFGGVVAENAMKFGSIHPSRNNFNFTSADALMGFAEENGMRVRGHTLVWHSQAGWVEHFDAPRDTLLEVMRHHITTVVTRYKGRIFEWDVVNEAVTGNGGLRETFWLERIGPDYIDSAFVFAHRADSTALLFYNDYNAETMNAKSQGVYDLVSGLLQRGVPVHGVGLQSHFIKGQINATSMAQNMARLEALGLRISITELDIRFQSASDTTLGQQKADYKAVAETCFLQPACRTFFVWGVNDAQSWWTPASTSRPLLFTGTNPMTPKPSYFGVLEALHALPAVVPDTVPSALRPARALDERILTVVSPRESGSGVLVHGMRGNPHDLRGRRIALPQSADP